MSAPSRALTDLVDDRDNRSCQRCGVSIASVHGSRHHRMRRRDGGHSASNLVLLCGSGSSGCHGRVHAYVAEARAEGWILPALRRPELDPARVPVKTLRHGWVQLLNDGTRHRLIESVAVAVLVELGMREAA